MSKVCKLVHVSVDNGKTEQSNKFYTMIEQTDGTFKVEYGRVGKAPKIESYPMSMWDKKYREKTGVKGYKDVTNLFVESVTTSATPTASTTKQVAIKNANVRMFVDTLMGFANKSIKQNYKVSQDAVTQAQVDEAQRIVDNICREVKVGCDINKLNRELMQLYMVIPREMKNVKDYLLPIINDKYSLERAQKLIKNEQDTLDTMAGQVKLIAQQKDTAATATDNKKDAEVDMLEQMGLEITEVNDSEIAMIKKMMGPNANQFRRAFKVINKKTQMAFNNQVAKAKNKKTELFWHGSRNENWFNIAQTGLLIRPAGAIHTGSMFSDGIYFADKAQKSIGYTSHRGSYWANGNSDKAYLALFETHVGNQRHIYKHDNSCYEITYNKLQKEGFDSVYAHGGADLRNNEFIVYTVQQCTIKYIVEFA